MPDIFHEFSIIAKPGPVFAAITTPSGLNEWWTKTCAGELRSGGVYELGFGHGVDWRARVTAIVPNEVFELQMIEAHADWMDTRVRFEILSGTPATPVRFSHVGWPSNNSHYRVSSFCWAAYLRILRRYVEHGEHVPYEKRLEV